MNREVENDEEDDESDECLTDNGTQIKVSTFYITDYCL